MNVWGCVTVDDGNRLAGFITGETIFGQDMVRVDVPSFGSAIPYYFRPAAINTLVVTSEASVRGMRGAAGAVVVGKPNPDWTDDIPADGPAFAPLRLVTGEAERYTGPYN